MAAFHAYKFTHFYDMKEVGEHARYEEAGSLEKVKALLFGIKSYKKVIQRTPAISYKTIQIITDDSLQLESWYLVHSPADSIKSKGTVIMFHGHGGNKAGNLQEVESFYHLGYNVLVTDFRAHGNSQGNICTIGFDEAKDVKAAYDFISTTGEKNIILWGISLGAAAEMKAIADYDLRPAKAIFEMPFGSLLEAVKGRCRILGVPQQPIASLLTFWGGTQQGFWAFDHNPSEYAKQINCPVLLQWGEEDNRVSKDETEAVFKNLSSTKKYLVKYSNSGHQSLCTSENEKWMRSVANFLQ